MSELKPCPACGGVAEMKRQGNDYTKKRRIVVRCPACRLERADAAIHHSMEWLEGVATKNWNTRPIEDALRAEVAKAEAERDNFRAEASRLRDEIQRIHISEHTENEALRAEGAKYRGMEVENAGLKTDNEAYIERIAELLDKITALKAELAKRDEPLTDEQAERAFAIAKENGVGECDTLAHGVQGIDAAIRRVRKGE